MKRKEKKLVCPCCNQEIDTANIMDIASHCVFNYETSSYQCINQQIDDDVEIEIKYWERKNDIVNFKIAVHLN